MCSALKMVAAQRSFAQMGAQMTTTSNHSVSAGTGVFRSCGFLGPAGTYTEEVALEVAQQAELIPLSSIEAVFQAVANGVVEIGVVPIENLIQGPVTEVLDYLFSYAGQVTLVDMRILAIRHGLGVRPGSAPTAEIHSKDQALKQCSTYLQNHHAGIPLRATLSTTTSMQAIASGELPDTGVIGSVAALTRHGLQVVADNIGNVLENKTKFAVIAGAKGHGCARTGADTTLCVVYPHRDRIGFLRTLVDVISERCGLNLSAIHSRPDTRGAFRFYLEIAGHVEDASLRNCIALLRSELSEADVVVAGSFPRTPFIEQRIRSVAVVTSSSGPSGGDMGAWMAEFLRAFGYDVAMVEPAQLAGDREMAADVKAADLVFVSVPRAEAIATWRQLKPFLGRAQLWVEHGRERVGVLKYVQGEASGDVEVLGLTLDFEFESVGVRNHTVVCSRTQRSRALAYEFESLLYREGANLECWPVEGAEAP